uniref:SSD domain-containing protein n=1 Tax=Timspurckia oligopyrenoides TaxID=708627 RepID=A0A7S0ZFC8_9RHOD|mmetsp:Transcript_304/g.561  ORF Transcript_304/g.561 Transcript_304/m.561 type:complete len:1057 (+) Transcript_304:105-3275(+)
MSSPEVVSYVPEDGIVLESEVESKQTRGYKFWRRKQNNVKNEEKEEKMDDDLIHERRMTGVNTSPLTYARWCIDYTLWLNLIYISVPILCGLILYFTDSLSLAGQSSNDYLVFSNEVVTRSHSLIAARDQLNDAAEVTERSLVDGSYTVYLMYRAKGSGEFGNMLSPAQMAFVKRVEDELRFKVRNYSNHCWFDQSFVDCSNQVPNCALPESLITNFNLYGILDSEQQYVCGLSNSTGRVSDAAIDAAVESLLTESGNVNPEYAFLLGYDFSADSSQMQYLRSSFLMGTPLDGYQNANDQENEQRSTFEKFVIGVVDWALSQSTSETEVMIFNSVYLNYVFSDLTSKAFAWAIGSVIFVFAVIWFHTTSGYLAVMVMIQILLSFPVTYFIYRFICQITYFSSFHILSVFLILGIGADDCFVFTDTWHQSAVVLGAEASDLERLSFSFRRASKAMFVTSITTAAAFFITAASPIMPISTFGVWAGLLILVQYIWCILMYPCNLIVWHRFWRIRHWNNWLRKPKENDQKDLESPAVVESNSESAESGTRVQNPEQESPTAEKDGVVEDNDRPDISYSDTIDYRPIERFFRVTWNRYVYWTRYVNVAFCLALFGVCVWLSTRLEPLQESEEWIPKSHPSMKGVNWMNDFFLVSGSAETFLTVDVTYGVSGIDRSSRDIYKPEEIGTVIWDTTFSLLPAANQEAVLNVCQTLAADPELVVQQSNAAQCWILDFVDYMSNIKVGTPGLISYETEEQLVADVEEFLNYVNSEGTQPYIRYRDSEQVGIVKDENGTKRFAFFFFRFLTRHRDNSPAVIMNPVIEQWSEAISAFNEENPEGVNKAFSSGGFWWPFTITQVVLVDSCFQGLGLAIGIACIVLLLSTLNVIACFVSTFCIGGIVTSVLGSVYLFGWQLGLIETVAAVIVVGFSVDYVVHLANAYVESKHHTRFKRMRDSLTDMGVSVLFGAITTAGAGAFLFGPDLLFFPKFGALLMTTIAYSALWSLVFFCSIMHVIGPNDNFGNLRPFVLRIWKKMTSCCSKHPKSVDVIETETSSVEELNSST